MIFYTLRIQIQTNSITLREWTHISQMALTDTGRCLQATGRGKELVVKFQRMRSY
jgi:hypothetical protein